MDIGIVVVRIVSTREGDETTIRCDHRVEVIIAEISKIVGGSVDAETKSAKPSIVAAPYLAVSSGRLGLSGGGPRDLRQASH
jgi:hypothetical protein